jgi:hypothetical protein
MKFMAKLPKFPKAKLPEELEEKPKKRKKSKGYKVSTPSSTRTTKKKRKTVPKSANISGGKRTSKTKIRKRRVAHPVLTRTRANVKATIRRAEKRGYRFSDAFKEYVSQASLGELRQIQRNKYQELYEQATALSDGGLLISGTEKRLIEKQRAIEKARATRERNKLIEKYGLDYVLKQEAELAQQETETEPEDTFVPTHEPPDVFYHEPEEIDNEPDFEEQEKARRLDFKMNKNDPDYRKALDLGDIAWDTIKDVISGYEKMGDGLFGMYFTDMMEYYEERYSYDTIKYAISMIYEDYLEIAQDIIFYNSNINELVNSVNNLKKLIDKALTYSGLTPDFKWDMSFDEVKDKGTASFLSEAEYPY